MGKSRNGVDMPESNYNINYEYKLSFSLEMILDFDTLLTKTCPCRHI